MTRTAIQKDETAERCHLESIAQATVQAMFVDRNFNPNIEPWIHYHRDFDETADSSTPQFVSRVQQQPSSPASDDSEEVRPTCASGLAAWLSFNQELAQANPDWSSRLVDATCTEYNRRGKYAAVVMNTMVSGLPVGITRPLLTLLEFKLINGKWMVSSYKMLPGVDYALGGAVEIPV